MRSDPTLLSSLSTNLMRALLCQCTKRGKRFNHFCLDAWTTGFVKVNFGGIIKHHHLSGGETGEEALLRLLLPPWLVRYFCGTNSFCNNVFSSMAFMISPCSFRLKVYIRVSQKNQKSEFCFATKPTGFHRLDEPPEKISAL